MNTPKRFRRMRAFIAAGTALAMATALAGPAAHATTDRSARGPIEVNSTIDAAAKISPRLSNREGPISVFVQTTGVSALETRRTAVRRGVSGTALRNRVQSRVAAVETVTRRVAAAAQSSDVDATVLYDAAYTLPGVALRTDAKTIRELAKRNDVVRITPIAKRTLAAPNADDAAGTVTPANANGDNLIGVPATWTGGNTGEGVNIAVIDTGIDYTHKDFGGPGTPAAYDSAAASTEVPEPAWYDSNKYLGGYDFAGPDYDAEDPDSVPEPDSNPIDGLGGAHGTHVAGTAAGYGVDTAGDTYAGDYANITAAQLRDDFLVAPGSAPKAGIFGLKVFGDTAGSTDVVGAALEWIGEHNATAPADQQIHIANLSLGGAYAPADDPENLMVDELSASGVLMVIAAGNEGDITDVSGAPGNAASALTVAATSTGYEMFDAITIDAPGAVAGQLPGQYSVNYTGSGDVSAPVVVPPSTENRAGCDEFNSTDAAAIQGKIVWLSWNDLDLECGSGLRFNNATAAGAVGVLLTSVLDSFEAGIAGNADIPGFQLTATGTANLQAAATAGTLEVTLTPDQLGVLTNFNPANADTPASFTSRGGHGSYNQIVKPDVAAPGVSVVSAGVGSGTGIQVMSGTSMATPMTAGVAALVKQAQPTWDALRIKTQLINTATQDVTDAAGTQTYAPLRVGTGRIDAIAAVSNEVFATSVQNGDLVTASFGVLEVSAPLTQTRTIKVTNDSSTAQTYDVSYVARTTQPGVEYTVSPAQVTVAAGATSDVTLTLAISDPAQLRRTIDPTQEAEQSGLSRQFVSDASGIVELSPQDTNASPLRVAVFAAPKPASDMSASNVVFGAGQLSSVIDFKGRDVFQGAGSETYGSIVAPLVLGMTDPIDVPVTPGAADQTLAASDIVAVGASTTAPQLAGSSGFDLSDGLLTIGVATAGNWAALSPLATPVVYFDVDGDGQEDYYTYTTPLSDTIDLPVAVTVDANDESQELDIQAVNLMLGDIDTNIFDTNVMLLPVTLGALGYSNASQNTSLRYRVEFENYYAPETDYITDTTSWVNFDVRNPALWFGGAGDDTPIYDDYDASAVGDPELPITRASATTSASVLLLHLHNGTGKKVEIISAGSALSNVTSTSLNLKPEQQRYGAGGAVAQVTVTTQHAAAPGRVEIRKGAKVVASAQIPAGQKSVNIKLRPKMAVGKHRLVARYAPAAGSSLTGSTSATATLQVKKAKAKVKVKAPKKTKQGKRVKVRVTIKAKGVKPTGRIVIRQGKKVVGKSKVKKGKATVRINTRAGKAGKRTYKVTYKATKKTTKATKKFKVQVRR
ncbi:PA domain-containing protein [Micrococcales bacterium KH10]|nr:PA domain-containing protein [Micrococcales bacterium KH10]